MLRRILKRLATSLLVSSGDTAIRAGQLKGRLLPRSIASSNLAMVLGRYEADIQELLSHEATGCQVTYDVGAHVGFFTLLFGHVTGDSGTVIAFEPSESEASRVEELVRCNQMQDRVTVERFAVCDEVAQLVFFTGHASFTGILDKVSKSHNRDNQTSVTVQGITLDEFVYGRNNPAPDLMKIDVESAEASVIRGAKRLLTEKRPKMLIEVHGPTPCKDTITEVLALGYQIEFLGPDGRVRVTEPDQLKDQFWKGHWTNHLLACAE